MIITKPEPTEYAQFYESYIKKVKQNDVLDALQANKDAFVALVNAIPQDKGDYRYADGKWTVKEVLLHVMDAERVFAYRALTFARKDKTELPAFDEDMYVPNSGAPSRSLFSLHDEFVTIRDASLSLFKSFNGDMMMSMGTANRRTISVRALGFIIAGHNGHHLEVIKERYL